MMERYCVFMFERDGLGVVFYSSDFRALEKLWEQRHGLDSPAGDWLATLTEPLESFRPKFQTLSKVKARTIAVDTRKLFTNRGCTVLSLRTRDTYNGGAKNPRGVITDDGTRYGSIGDAARSEGVSKATICRRLRRGKYQITN